MTAGPSSGDVALVEFELSLPLYLPVCGVPNCDESLTTMVELKFGEYRDC
jgi:hypothetical protein